MYCSSKTVLRALLLLGAIAVYHGAKRLDHDDPTCSVRGLSFAGHRFPLIQGGGQSSNQVTQSSFTYNYAFNSTVHTDSTGTHPALLVRIKNVLAKVRAGAPLSTAEESDWLKLKAAFAVSFDNDNGATISNVLIRAMQGNEALRWVFCAWIDVSQLNATAHFMRACIPYNLLGRGFMSRIPEENKDYIEPITMWYAFAVAVSNVNGPVTRKFALRNAFSRLKWQFLSPSNSSNAAGGPPVFINIFKVVRSERFLNRCIMNNTQPGGDCTAICCNSAYMSSPYCTKVPFKCA